MKIDKNVPLPPRTHKGKWADILREMKINDSIFVKTANEINSIRVASLRLKKPIIQRHVKGGWRCWRVKKSVVGR